MFDFSLVDRRHFRFIYLTNFWLLFCNAYKAPHLGLKASWVGNYKLNLIAQLLHLQHLWQQHYQLKFNDDNLEDGVVATKPDLSYTLYLYSNVQLRKSSARGQHIRYKIFFVDLNQQSKIILKTQFSLYFVHPKNNIVAISCGHKVATACKQFNLQNR